MSYKTGTIFSKYILVMTKKVLLFAFLMIGVSSLAQKAQRIGYIDMEYILENIPEYTEAQNNINEKALIWQRNIEKEQQEIEALKNELNNERALLTSSLIAEKEEDIDIKTLELKKLQETYFGANGDLFFLRKQMVQPIQDMVFNAIQDIAVKRKYDFVFDKTSDLVMLYANNQYDISEMVIKAISRNKKISAAQELQQENSEAIETINDKNDKASEILSERERKREELRKKIEEQKAAKLKKREELKKAIEEKRQQRIKEIEDAKKATEEKKDNN